LIKTLNHPDAELAQTEVPSLNSVESSRLTDVSICPCDWKLWKTVYCNIYLLLM